jgi:hypothetical protein
MKGMPLQSAARGRQKLGVSRLGSCTFRKMLCFPIKASKLAPKELCLPLLRLDAPKHASSPTWSWMRPGADGHALWLVRESRAAPLLLTALSALCPT